MATLAATSNPTIIDGLGLQLPEDYSGLPRPSHESFEIFNRLLDTDAKDHAVMYNHKRFVNHMAHGLTSVYFLGGTASDLQTFYDANENRHIDWDNSSPSEITDDNWRDHLGEKEYETAYARYFLGKIDNAGGNWRKVLRQFLIEEGLFPGLFLALLHPMIHLHYAYETDNPGVAANVLTMVAIHFVDIEKLLKQPSKEVPQTPDIVEILNEVRSDESHNGLRDNPRYAYTQDYMKKFPERVAYYANRFKVEDDPREQLGDLLKATAALFGATHKDNDPQYDFFLLHALTSMHAVVEIMSNPDLHEVIPPEYHQRLVKDLWIVYYCVYEHTLCPKIDVNRVTSVDLVEGSIAKTWQRAIDTALHGKNNNDEHMVKAVRALLFAELYNKDKSGFYARIAYQFTQTWSTVGTYAGRITDPVKVDIKYRLD